MEYEIVKKEMSKEMGDLKKKLIIFEAELQQNKSSLKNSNDLLVEKTSIITELKETLKSREDQIRTYEKTIENFRLEICTYQSTINDMQHQMQNINPFNMDAKRFNSEELQKAHQNQISRLETLLEERTNIAKICEKEKLVHQEEVQRLLQQQIEDKNVMNTLTKNFDSAQKQCEELIEVIELLTKENNIYKIELILCTRTQLNRSTKSLLKIV
ncbi:hypothetical protein JTB14_014107 [Gonioctena quinquepunctata]|nr:hypothetical protein JTB14_014107 [Gonioctena quinquepunctata]